MNGSQGAEVLKLARLLHCEPERLAYLEALDVAELRALRDRTVDALFDADRERFQRVAAAAKLPPVGLTATIAQKTFGPLLVSRVAALTDTTRAVEIAQRLEPEFLADVAIDIDPRRASAVIAGIPAATTGQIAGVLCRRGEYVAMGRFVGHLTDAAIVESLKQIDDPALLRISYVLEERHRLDQVLRLLGPERQASAIRAASEHDLWPEALDLLGSVGDELAGELADLAAAQDDAVLTGMVDAAQRDGLWQAVLPVVRAMGEAERRRFARLRALHRKAVLDAIVRAAAAAGLWSELLPLVSELPPSARRKAWPVIVDVAADLPDRDVRAIVTLALDSGMEDLVGDLVTTADTGGDLEAGVRVLSRLGVRLQTRLVPLTERVDVPQRERALAAARDARLLTSLGPLRDALAS